MTKKKQVGYEFQVRGTMRVNTPNSQGKGLEFYGPLTFYLPEIVEVYEGHKMVKKTKLFNGKPKQVDVPVPDIKRYNAALGNVANHIISRYYLPAKLKELHPTKFTSVQTHEVISKKRVYLEGSEGRRVNDVPIQDQTESELLQFCVFNDLIVNMNSYGNLADKRRVVEQAYKQKQEQRENEVTPVRHNPDLQQPDDVVDETKEPPPSTTTAPKNLDDAITDDPNPLDDLE